MVWKYAVFYTAEFNILFIIVYIYIIYLKAGIS